MLFFEGIEKGVEYKNMRVRPKDIIQIGYIIGIHMDT